MLLIIKDTPYEIDTAVHEGKRWVEVWQWNKSISPFETVDEAVSFIEEIMEEKDTGDRKRSH